MALDVRGRQAAPSRRPSAPSRSSVLGAQSLLLALVAGVVLRLVLDVAGAAGLLSLGAAAVVVAALALVWRLSERAPRARAALSAAGLVVGAAMTGLLLAVVGGEAGPLAMVLLPVVVAVLVLVLVRPAWALVVVVLVVPVGLQDVPGQAVGLQVMQVTAIVVLGIAVVSRLLAGAVPLLVPRQLVWAVLLVAWGGVALLSAADLEIGLRQLVQLAVNVGLALLAATVLTTAADVRRVLRALLVVGSLSSVPALAGADDVRASFGGGVVAGRLEGFFTQPNEFGSFAMVVTVLGAALLVGARSARERATTAALLVPVVLGLLLSLSRGSWIGAAAGALVLVVLLPRARRGLLVAGVPLLLLAVVLGAFAPENPQVRVVGDRVSTLTEAGGGNPYDDRPRIWAEGRREVALDPVTGHGPGAFPVVSTRSASQAQTVQAEHAHSVLLTVAAEYGLPGAALLVGLTVSLALLVLASVRGAAPRTAALVAGLAAACCAVAAQGVIDYTMRNAVLFTVYWLLPGLLVAAGRAALAERAEDGTTARRLSG